MADALPVLWIYGPAGVGKTTVAWEYFTRLVGTGVRAGFVDIDQLGMCYGPPTAQDWAPEPVSDPVRYRLKAVSLDAVVAQHRALGSQCLVVPGIVDPERGVDPAMLPNADLTLCRLRAEPEDLARRIAARGRDSDSLDEILRDARALDEDGGGGPEGSGASGGRGGRGLSGACVDTTGLDVDKVLAKIAETIGAWPGVPGAAGVPGLLGPAASQSPAAPTARCTDPGEILFVCGPAAVGKSHVAWLAYAGSRRLGQHTAFADLEQIGFQRPADPGDPLNHRLKAANVAVLWRNFHARGARRFVVNGPLDRAEDLLPYAEALPAARITVCRLHASAGQLAERIGQRAAGAGSARGLAGDTLLGLRDAVERSVAQAFALERSGVGDLRVVTDGRTPAELAEEILRRAAWS